MVREEALDWLEEAKADLRRAERALQDGDYSLSCYLSQQAAEKALKALLIGVKRKRPPHVHDLTALYSEVGDALPLPEEVREGLAEVSQYYVTARYPSAGLRRPSESFTRGQAARALEVARRVVGEAGRALAAQQG